MKLRKHEQKIFDEVMEDLESNTYTREEIVDKKMARAVKFFVVETALKEPLKRAIRKSFSLRDAYNSDYEENL